MGVPWLRHSLLTLLLAAPTHAQSLNEGSRIQNKPRAQIEIKSWSEEFGPATRVGTRAEPTTTGSAGSAPAMGLAASGRAECEVITVRSPQTGSTVIRKFFKCG